jgi:ketosteroid isomerase-like protein
MKFSVILSLLLFLYSHPVWTADPMYEISQLLKKGKKEQALEQIDAYLSSQPKDAWGRNITQMRFLKGTLLAEQKRTGEAIQIFLKLTQDYPDLPEPYNNLAVLYAAKGHPEEARAVLEKALRTDPAYATAYRNLNEIYAQLASQAYDHTLQASKGGQPAPALIKELCDNFGRMANQSVGRKQASGGEISMVRDISKFRTSAGAPPSKVDIDEMAVAPGPPESSLPLAFTDPAAKPAPQVSGVVVAAKPDAVTKAVTSHETAVTTPQQASPGEEKAVLAVVQAWAGAWSHKKVGAYLAFYSRDFRAPNSQSRSEWAKLRHERIERPKSIRVTVDMPKVAVVDATHATVSFRQGYRSDDLQTSTRKTLLMVKQGGEWLIQEERVGG